MRQVFVHFRVAYCANFLRYWATRMSYFKWLIWYINCSMRLCQVSFHFLVFFCSANSWYNAQQKVVPRKDMPDKPIFDWDCQGLGHLPFLYCGNFLDVGQEKGVKWQDISDISNFDSHLSGICLISCCLLVKLLRHWATRSSNKWRDQYFNDLVSGTCSFSCCLVRNS